MMNDVARGPGLNLSGGTVLAGRFRLEQPLGSGGMAEVWRAFDLQTQRQVALKLLRPQVATSAEAVQRFRREGEVLSQISHPGIVRVESYGQLESGAVYLAMELLIGETLGARMRRGIMEPVELVPIVAGTCAALAAAHAKGVIHRDLKPDNIFLVGDPAKTTVVVKLLDFGISKVYGSDRLTHTGEVLGTPRYMSPEQLGTEPNIDLRVDVYALGVILYEAMAGRPPFLAGHTNDLIVAILHGSVTPLRSVRPGISDKLEAVVMRSIARARAARYASATEMAEAFVEAVGVTPAPRAAARRDLATVALGGAGGVPSFPPDPHGLLLAASQAPAAAVAAVPPTRMSDPDVMRPGTFSGVAIESSKLAALDPATADTALSPPESAAARSAREARASLMPAFVPAPAAETGPFPPSAASGPYPAGTAGTGRHAAAVETGRPKAPPGRHARARGGASPAWTIGLVIGSLIAGGLTAGLVVAAMSWARAGLSPVETPPPPAIEIPSTSSPSEAPPEPAPTAPDTPEEPARTETGDSTPPAPAATGPDAVPSPLAVGADLPAEDPEPESSSSRGSRRTRRPRDEPAPPPETAPQTQRPSQPAAGWGGASPLQMAQRALREHRADECLEILEDAMQRGRTPTMMRVRAECLLAAGRSADAIREYQRYCELGRDDPGYAAVRELLAGRGIRCGPP